MSAVVDGRMVPDYVERADDAKLEEWYGMAVRILRLLDPHLHRRECADLQAFIDDISCQQMVNRIEREHQEQSV